MHLAPRVMQDLRFNGLTRATFGCMVSDSSWSDIGVRKGRRAVSYSQAAQAPVQHHRRLREEVEAVAKETVKGSPAKHKVDRPCARSAFKLASSRCDARRC